MMRQAPEKTLVSLAYLKTLWDKEKKDLLDIYLPFLAELFRRKSYTFIEEKPDTINRISKEIEEEFGLKIPYHPLLSLLNRARKRKLLERKQHKYYVKEEMLLKYGFNIDNAQRSINNLIELIVKHAKNLFPNESITADQIKEALVDYLNSFGPHVLISEIEGLADFGKSKAVKKRKELFIINKVILYMYENDKEGWTLLQNVAAGYVLSSMILYDQNAIKAKLRGLNIYLDTRIIFRLIGVEGEEMKEVYKRFIDELRKEDTELYIFQHTYEEILDILEGCYKWIDDPQYDPSKASLALRHFKEKGYHQSDIILLRSKLKSELTNLGIEIKSPPVERIEYKIDEEKLKNCIKETYEKNPSFVYYEKEYTIERDVQSISAICQMRRGNKPVNLKQMKYIFITPNAGLAHAAGVFYREEFQLGGFYIPPCVTDTFLATMVWINNPVKVQEIMPTVLISLSMAILKHSEEFIGKWHLEIRKLLQQENITEEDFILLRDSHIAREQLDEKTLGDPDLITPKTALEILDEIKTESLKLYEEERKKHEETQKQLEKQKEEKEKMERRISHQTEKITKWIIGVIFSLAVILFILTIIFHENKIWRYTGGILTVIFTVMGFLGITVKRIKFGLKRKIEKFLKGE